MTTNMMREKPADWLDVSREQTEREVYDEVQRIQAKAHTLEAPFLGKCLDCEEPFKEGDRRRWCDDACRDSWQKARDRKKNNIKIRR